MAWRPEVGFPSRSEASNRSANQPITDSLPRSRTGPLVPGAYGGCPYRGAKTLKAEAFAAGLRVGLLLPEDLGLESWRCYASPSLPAQRWSLVDCVPGCTLSVRMAVPGVLTRDCAPGPGVPASSPAGGGACDFGSTAL